MSFDMTRNWAFMFRTTDGGTVIAAQKESFSAGLETEYWSRIGREAWGDNKVDNIARGDIKVDNNVWDDTLNRSRTRTTTPYNIRTRSGGVVWVESWVEKAVVCRSDAGRTERNLRND